jgi:hypothetical protein
MAGDWIKVRTNLWDDPRVARLCDLTDQGEASVIGGLYWLWSMADSHTEDGILPGLTLRAIDRKTGVQGLGDALCSIGWMADHPEGVVIIGFEQHNGVSAKRRCTDAQAKANKRKPSAGSPSIVQEMSACDADKAQTSDGQKMDNCGAREEKRREEKLFDRPSVIAAPAEPDSGYDDTAIDANQKPGAYTPPPCPHRSVLALWAEVLPQLPQHNPDMWQGARADHLRARWRETAVSKAWPTQEKGLLYFRKLFAYIGQSAFLAGQVAPRQNGGRPFVAELEWILTPTKWARLHEGKYHESDAEVAA